MIAEKTTAERKLAEALERMLDEEEGVKREPKPAPRRRTPVKGEKEIDDPRGELQEMLEDLGLNIDSMIRSNWDDLKRPPGRRKETADPEDDA